MIKEKQLRIIYSLLKPVVSLAARFEVPMRSLAELFRLAYFEYLHRQGFNQKEIASRFGQSDRRMRSLSQQLKSDFFAAEEEAGLTRDIEDFVATSNPNEKELFSKFQSWNKEDIHTALSRLIHEERVKKDQQGKLTIGQKYVVLTSEHFHHRIDALNHFLTASTNALTQRLIFENKETSAIKTISFSANTKEFQNFLISLEGEVRAKIAQLEESALFSGEPRERFTISITASPNINT